jgi:hypothetical protein
MRLLSHPPVSACGRRLVCQIVCQADPTILRAARGFVNKRALQLIARRTHTVTIRQSRVNSKCAHQLLPPLGRPQPCSSVR